MIFGYKAWAKFKGLPEEGRGVKPTEADFYSGKEQIDAEEREYLAERAAKGSKNQGGKFYRRWVSWLL